MVPLFHCRAGEVCLHLTQVMDKDIAQHATEGVFKLSLAGFYRQAAPGECCLLRSANSALREVTPRKGAVWTVKGRNFFQTLPVDLWERVCQRVTHASFLMKPNWTIYKVCKGWTCMLALYFMGCQCGSSSSFWNEINVFMQCQIQLLIALS